MFSVTGKLAQPLVGTEGEIWIISNGYISFHKILDQIDAQPLFNKEKPSDWQERERNNTLGFLVF